MRLMHYNIYKGGKGRLDGIIAVIQEANPDVLGILEANDWDADNTQQFESFKKRTGYPFGVLSPTTTGYHIACFSKKEPEVFIDSPEGFHHTVCGAVIDSEKMGKVAVLFYHANPYSEELRVREGHALIDYAATFDHAVIMGDFNALSPHDAYPKEEMLANLKSHGIKKFGDDTLLFDSISTFEKAGWIDTAVYLNMPFDNSTPTPFNEDVMHSVPVRLDYAFVTPGLESNIEKVTLLKNELTDTHSDHYPLVLDIQLS